MKLFMYNIIFCTCLLFSLTIILSCTFDCDVVEKHKENNLILWQPNITLTWDNFKGVPDSLSEYKAMTYTQIRYNSKLFDDSVVFQVTCKFIENLSWSKDKTSKNLLKHEMLHFDIAELVTRKIRKEFLLHKSIDIFETAEILKKIHYNFTETVSDSINAKYDSDTNHGKIEEKQKEWELKIAKELVQLNKYASTKVVIKREKK